MRTTKLTTAHLLAVVALAAASASAAPVVRRGEQIPGPQLSPYSKGGKEKAQWKREKNRR